MTDDPAARVAQEALELWTAGQLAPAEARYRDALQLIPDGHWAQPHVRAQLASVVAAQGRNGDARDEFERTLAEELALADGDEGQPAVRISRYFLGEHLVRMGEPQLALAIVEPAFGGLADFALRLVEADAWAALGDTARAVAALESALESSPSDEQREDVRARIAGLRRVR